MDLSNFREEYLKGQLHRKDLAENPFEQFQTWFEQALKADIPEPNAFSLATADAQGGPPYAPCCSNILTGRALFSSPTTAATRPAILKKIRRSA